MLKATKSASLKVPSAVTTPKHMAYIERVDIVSFYTSNTFLNLNDRIGLLTLTPKMTYICMRLSYNQLRPFSVLKWLVRFRK